MVVSILPLSPTHSGYVSSYILCVACCYIYFNMQRHLRLRHSKHEAVKEKLTRAFSPLTAPDAPQHVEELHDTISEECFSDEDGEDPPEAVNSSITFDVLR